MPASEPVEGNAAQIAYWNDRAGETWAELQARIDANFSALTALALEAAAPQAGERVIDIGCGCGATVLDLARRVGPTGSVLGVDVSEPMAARARARIAAAGLAQAQVQVADAAAGAFDWTGADLMFSRFGVMFFAEPAAAFAHLRRQMRPGGRLLFACWRPLAENPWFTVPLEAGRPFLPPQPPADPTAPGPFAFADPERVRQVLATAGWREIGVSPREAPMRMADADDLDGAAAFATRVGALARLLADSEPETHRAVKRAVREALRAHDGPDGIALTGSVWLVSARA
ncbi:class I SAM-dependent methyltransferase [Methylobacterium planeticum]|nr:class I SAM-dependent methyltransferase [Methylobacterium planeticum]